MQREDFIWERLKMGVSYTEGEKKRASVKKAKKGEGR
jgi:hypothetical protein